MRNQGSNAGRLSRRDLLRGVAVAVGGVSLVAMTSETAVAKMSQAAAGYQDKPKDDQSCATCGLFKAPSACSLVDGTVSPTGWCRFYAKKS